MIYIRIHNSDNGSVVAMCDKALIDRVLIEGEIVMDIKTYASFYNDKLVGKDEAKRMIGEADGIYSANIVGEEAVGIALEMKIIEAENILNIQKVPYAHAYRVEYPK
ncbi:MAG: DUF424 family protein [Candidatus Micrarchaeales archaeon]|nr:DUF424 family protein [Candidatus Micrarchaeales archaeon]